MGLRERLTTAAVRRVAVLVVEVPGWGRTRCAAEEQLRRRGWRPALTPADADALLVCGVPGARLAAAVDLVWDQLPGPRARAEVLDPAGTAAALDRVVAELSDDAAQRADAASRPGEPAMGIEAGADPAQDDAEDMDHGDDDPEDDSEDMDDGDMDMDMPMPAGIPLAGGGDARDGLEMDVLHVPLGPVLPAWPAGLVLHCTVQGDVVQETRAEVLPPDPAAEPDGDLVPGSPADRCDRAAGILALAGWADAAAAAARLRDDLLSPGNPGACRSALERLTRRVRRSRTLRWTLPGQLHGRLLALLDEAAAALTGTPTPIALLPLDDLAPLVTGQELGAVRLRVAAAELAPGTLVRSGAGLS
ncbi:hypothetical protein SAMN04515665_104100 [Blastococcus sp. DSM 46786]|uniref:hypothetical protein n=1 Tax=Blastococcus sp. DSM 46786 TaxID=1798227 RepID=UPI0008ABA02A|nr:hypothetical protein [Blastococcus sp. DSM 46786]SEK68158.1 hypothetical protein SAMN04515665_104100 [Blastococcus sp. DSM 46786]